MARGQALLIIERILRDRDGVWRQIGEERDLGRLIGQMLTSSALAFAVYGAVLGASHSVAQAALSAVKLPLLFFITLAICLPTLYLFNLVFGARLQVRQALALVLVTITVTAVLSLAFAPISLFFLITTSHYAFYKLLNVAVLGLAALVGLRFLTAGMAALNTQMAASFAVRRAATAPDPTVALAPPVGLAPAVALPQAAPAEQPVTAQAVPAQPVPAQVGAWQAGPAVATNAGALPNGHPPAPADQAQPLTYPAALQPRVSSQPVPQSPGEKPASMTLLYIWTLLFGFVGTQLAWTLRPFVGDPDQPFQIFREIDGNFYVDIVRTLGHLL